MSGKISEGFVKASLGFSHGVAELLVKDQLTSIINTKKMQVKNPLPAGQISRKSYLPHSKIYLSWTTTLEFFQAFKPPLILSLFLSTGPWPLHDVLLCCFGKRNYELAVWQ